MKKTCIGLKRSLFLFGILSVAFTSCGAVRISPPDAAIETTDSGLTSFSIVLINEDDTTVTVLSESHACGCTLVTYKNNPIANLVLPPRSDTSIDVGYNAAGKGPRYEGQIVFYLSGDTQSSVEFYFIASNRETKLFQPDALSVRWVEGQAEPFVGRFKLWFPVSHLPLESISIISGLRL